VTGAVIDAISVDRPGRLLLADPFAGGGVIALAAVLRGHRIYAQDVNPWAARNLATMLDLPPHDELAAAAEQLRDSVSDLLDRAYATTLSDGTPASVAHTLRVATARCPGCKSIIRLFPSALVTLLDRVDCRGSHGYLACRAGHLSLSKVRDVARCRTCRIRIRTDERYTVGRTARCADCGWHGRLVDLVHAKGLGWEIALVERVGQGFREIDLPSRQEIETADDASWVPRRELPPIAPGVETAPLLAIGMTKWHDLFPRRQRVVLEALLDGCKSVSRSERVTRALETAVVGSTEMAGHASRWDGRYLKAYEVVANHRFSVTTLAVEPNVWGAHRVGRGTVERRVEQMGKAETWFGENIGRRLAVDETKRSQMRRRRLSPSIDARIVLGSSARLCVPDGHFDAVVTDPAYHDDVQYGELSDLFRAWAGQGTGPLDGDAVVCRLDGTRADTIYRERLTAIFREIHRSLSSDGHLVLSFANRRPAAWIALITALDDTGFRSVGFTVVHSENETDHAKSGRRSCNLDVLIDLVKIGLGSIRQFQPEGAVRSDEEAFCRIVGQQTLKIGQLTSGWDEGFIESLDGSAFLRR
jgi:hypothetical protein